MIKYYLVGGAVRDKILGLKSKDMDYAVEAESYDAMKADIIARGGEIFLETPQYFTIRAKLPKLGAADFVLCRKDGAYSDGRRPDSVERGTIYDDLARRDFTMNAIAEDADTGEVIDPHNGRFDIENKLISCVGSAEVRFEEDALRMLRAIRFAITKDFQIDWNIYSILKEAEFANKLKNVSVERIREELIKCFKHNTPATLIMLRTFHNIEYVIFNNPKLILIPTIQG